MTDLLFFAGNMSTTPAPAPPTTNELATPTLKADVFTTGRGGTGNMVSNDDPELARVRQDVDVPPPVARGVGDGGKVLLGRGTFFFFFFKPFLLALLNIYDPIMCPPPLNIRTV